MAYVIPTQMSWRTFAGSLGRAQDALAQADGQPGHSPIRINGSPRSLVPLANATDRASVHHRINPKLLGQALDLCIPLRLRQLGAEVCQAVAVLPDGHRVLSGGADGTLRLWDLESGTELRRFLGHAERVEAVAVLPDGHRVSKCLDVVEVLAESSYGTT